MHKRRAAQRRRARRGRSFRRPMAAGCFVVIHFRLRMFSVARHVVFMFEQAASSTRAAVKCTLAAYQTVRRSTPEVAARVVRRDAAAGARKSENTPTSRPGLGRLIARDRSCVLPR